jgi:hypothetical protein
LGSDETTGQTVQFLMRGIIAILLPRMQLEK